ncbi:hypothetical protein KC318_g2595 [Hortaea werneckii]|uniref:Uncharacterized protein n=1 Tax=Hortaea werneckii TaxID=91943 RepID=A0A3M6ZHT8_HORWE|nr:hypothetical protein KC334_g1975 [Hortaea werneckii]KAI7022789.1 hypothetical protein KC355_g1950 [Hortaea werneckii]KAI7672845.1 hypothetical protein KC318_g2595 [Hortaea werneckii]RMY14855.1 hypothetical protein D0867_07015 [Hortaea werneckii]RMY37637.1 hypothetical protein D0866_03139 [Hortaea werneckii]
MEAFLRLPASLLALVLVADIAGATSPQLSLSKYWNTTDNTQDGGVPPPTPTQPILTTAASLPSTGSGSEYASQCIHALTSFSSKSSAWSTRHLSVSNTTTIVGGPSYTRVTYYEGATTLCDGHPRLTTSPGISLSEDFLTFPGTGPTSTSTIVNTYGRIYPHETPTCSVEPSDCDPFWQAYSTRMSEWSALGAAQTTPAPQTPPCMNQSMASSAASFQSSFNGCGLCTIYGQGVELVYFPPPATAFRDMCASTPVANLTYYEPGAILEAYAGTQYGAMATRKPDAQTAVVGQNTFTSGTAYISISKVWAEDRCSKTKGTPVHNAILAMPSESVLSLRYSQDHFQYAMVTGTQTGFPVSYADFQTPIPWSAWNGQEQCYNSYGGYYCDVIYENKYRPQLAIPPEINMLNDDWKDCQLWYGGLYDPPLALQPAESIAMPTRPGHHQEKTSTAEPSSTLAKPTAEPTALADHDPNAQSNNGGGGDEHESSDGDGADKTRPGDGDEVWNGEEWVPAGNNDDDDEKSGGSHENGLPGPSRPDSHNDGGDAHHDDNHGGADGTGSSNDDSSDDGSSNGNSGMGGKGETGSSKDGEESSSHGGSSGQDTGSAGSSHDSQSGQGSSSSQGNTQGSESSNHAGGAGTDGNSDPEQDSSSNSGSQQENNSNHGSDTDAGKNGDSSNDASGNAQSTVKAANGATADAVSPQPTTNQVISACEEGVVIDGSTITLATQQPATTVQVNGYSHTIKQLGSGVVEVNGGMVIGAGNDAVTVTAGAGVTSGAPSSQSSGDAAADAIAAGMGMSGPHGGHGGSATRSGASTGPVGGSDGSQSTGASASPNGSGSSKDDGENSGSSANGSPNPSSDGRTSQQTSSTGENSASSFSNDDDDTSTQQQQTSSAPSGSGGGRSSASSSQTSGSGARIPQSTSTSAPTAAQQTTNAGSRISLLHVHGLVVGIMTFMIAIL